MTGAWNQQLRAVRHLHLTRERNTSVVPLVPEAVPSLTLSRWSSCLAESDALRWLHGFTPRARRTQWLEALLSTLSAMHGPDPASGRQSSPDHGPLALGVSCTKQSSPGLGGGRLPSSDHRAAANTRIKKRFREGSFLLTTPTRRKHKT